MLHTDWRKPNRFRTIRSGGLLSLLFSRLYNHIVNFLIYPYEYNKKYTSRAQLWVYDVYLSPCSPKLLRPNLFSMLSYIKIGEISDPGLSLESVCYFQPYINPLWLWIFHLTERMKTEGKTLLVSYAGICLADE